jgi:transcriptional regulator with XRE-family HTH domain
MLGDMTTRSTPGLQGDEVEQETDPPRWVQRAGQRLREIRDQAGMSQRQFADHLSQVWGRPIYTSQVSDWESGKVAMKAALLEAALSVSNVLESGDAMPLESDLQQLAVTMREIERRSLGDHERLEQLRRQVTGYEILLRGVLDALGELRLPSSVEAPPADES